MLHDTETGKVKRAEPGKCIICNGEAEIQSALGRIPFCRECWVAQDDDDKLSQRIVW